MGKGPNECGQELKIEFRKIFKNVVETAKDFNRQQKLKKRKKSSNENILKFRLYREIIIVEGNRTQRLCVK